MQPSEKKWDDISLEPVNVDVCEISQYCESSRTWQGIPGVCWAGGNRLFATWYSGGATEGPENYVLVYKSDDAGENWSEQIAVIDPPGQVRAFDPTIWRDPIGRVWLFWAQGWSPKDEEIWDGRAGVWCSVCSKPMENEIVWSNPRRICDGIMLNKPFVTRHGKWLLPVSVWNIKPFHPDTEGKRLAGLVTSYNDGQTFEYVGGAKILDNAFDEHVIFDRKNGDLVLWSRTLDGIAESISSDGGKTWSHARKNGMDCPNSRFSIARLSDTELLLVNHYEPRIDEYTFVRNRNTWRGRNNLSVLISNDDGKTWISQSFLDSRQGVSYPDIDVNEDGRIAVIYDYERYNTANIIITIFDKKNVYGKTLPNGVIISRLELNNH